MKQLAYLSALALAWLSACGPTKAPSAPVAPKSADALVLARARKQLTLARLSSEPEGLAEPLLRAMQAELARARTELARQPTPPFYIAYEAFETRAARLVASDGFLVSSNDDTDRSLDVDLRVGSPQLDNTHASTASPFLGLVSLPLGGDELALRTPIWLATERSFRIASEALIQVRASKTVQAEEEDQSPDFSSGTPVRHVVTPREFAWAPERFQTRLRELSRRFLKHPHIETSYVELDATAGTRYFVNTEGSVLQTSDLSAWVNFGGSITAQDGALLSHDRQVFARSLEELPGQAELEKQVDALIGELLALVHAPRGEPYIGPALLDGRAAAVLFHEVLGHRVEGHRQRVDWEGKTFKKKVGKRIMPRGFKVVDDPLIARINGQDLNGTYRFDDEGIPARSVDVVRNGIFGEFLMSRTPIEGFSSSNGHGRKQPGFRSVSRQGNLLVDPERVTTPEALKQALLEEIRRQHLPYGIRVSEVTGGETQTAAFDPQAFQVQPVLVYRVYPDGREELIRDVKLEGTPLSLLSNVLAAGNDYAVFNGFCGAESGQVPVAAASPSLLVSKIEMARLPKGTERPPILPPPGAFAPAPEGSR